mmetsp:Transcript_92310/g.232182  ORF Transcript_92310/g.232182 Transcript_92310/m.232182 type:complete len:259 (-) Transcript_92310:251-1027(-)
MGLLVVDVLLDIANEFLVHLLFHIFQLSLLLDCLHGGVQIRCQFLSFQLVDPILWVLMQALLLHQVQDFQHCVWILALDRLADGRDKRHLELQVCRSFPQLLQLWKSKQLKLLGFEERFIDLNRLDAGLCRRQHLQCLRLKPHPVPHASHPFCIRHSQRHEFCLAYKLVELRDLLINRLRRLQLSQRCIVAARLSIERIRILPSLDFVEDLVAFSHHLASLVSPPNCLDMNNIFHHCQIPCPLHGMHYSRPDKHLGFA